MGLIINSNLITPDMLDVEVVERKGLGHPDTLVDGIVEAAEIEYCTYCLDNFDVIPHHNFDKAMLLGGLCIQKCGGDFFKKPISFVFMGRGSKVFGNNDIPMERIQRDATIRYLSRILPNLDCYDDSKFVFKSITTSNSTRPFWFAPRDISDLPEYVEYPTANDTATMISYYPLTICEKIALFIESYFYSDVNTYPKPKYIEFGQDIKVMVVRHGSKIMATVAVPQITYHTDSLNLYFERERNLRIKLREYVMSQFPQLNINLIVNAQSLTNNPRPYLVTSGSCIDFGEEGAVGRGNKTRGVISSFRPNTMEAPHGKNSTYFVGKVLGYLCDEISREIFEATMIPCQVIMQANIGDKLFDPSTVIISTQHEVKREIVEQIVSKYLEKKRNNTLDIIQSAHYIPRVSID